MQSHATTANYTEQWTAASGKAGIYYSSDYDDMPKYFMAHIAHAKSGEQRLYFLDQYIQDKNICKYESIIPEDITMIFNNQAVKMSRWCKKFGDSGTTYYSYTPQTDRGNTYVINLFKTALLPIKIQLNNEIFIFPVTGFTKAWNSGGGNAI